MPEKTRSLFSVVSFAVALVASAGCAGTSPSSVSGFVGAAPQDWVAIPKAKRYVYGCAAPENTCDVYSVKGTLLRSLSPSDGLSAPAGTMADPTGLWYIANAGASNVLVFSAGGGALTKTLRDTGEVPNDVAISGQVVAASNEYATGPISTGSVSVYTNAATHPAYMLTVPGALQGIGVAFDRHGNCFWSYNDSPSADGHIAEFTGCKKGAKPKILGITLVEAGGMAFDQSDNLWYTDQGAGLFRCAGTAGCELVTNGFSDPATINFNATSTVLYLADPTFGLYDITHLAKAPSRNAHPDYIVTPFASSPGAGGVAAGPGL